MKSQPFFAFCGAALVLTGVVLGAFGAHALKTVLDAEQLSSFETGVRYQIFHGLSMLILAFRRADIHIPKEAWIQRLWLLGCALFSGSIYALTLGRSQDFSVKWAGPITPLGGTLLIVGWTILAMGLLRLALQKKA